MSIPERQVLLEHVGFLRAIALGVLRNEADADDAVQQTLATALQKPPADDSNLRGWLATVVRNFARMQLRSRSRRHAREESVARPEDSTPSAAHIAQRMEMERHVVDAVATLEEPFKTTLILRFYDDLQPKDIALRMGVPAATVRTRLKRGLEKLRAQLDRQNGGSRKATYAGLLLLAQLPARATPLRWIPVAGVAALLIGVVSIVSLIALNAEDVRDPGRRAPVADRPSDGNGEDAAVSERDQESEVLACVIAGRVLDPGMNPLQGAEVVAYEHAGASLLDTPMNRWRRWTEPPSELARTTTNALGGYELRIQPARPFWLVFQRSGFATRVLPVSEATGTYSGVDVALHPATGAKGVLTDDAGSPIAGATIRAWTPEYSLFGSPALISVRTDESGEYVLPLAGTYSDGRFDEINRLSLVVDARAAGYAPRVFRDLPAPFTIPRLHRHVPLAVHTAPGTDVIAFGPEAIGLAHAGNDGIATFPEFPYGGRTLVLLNDEYVPKQVQFDDAESTAAHIELSPGIVLGGLLNLGEFPRRLASAAIGVAPREVGDGMLFDALHATLTRPDGSFRLRAAPADENTLVVAHSAIVPRQLLTWRPTTRTRTIPEAEEFRGRVVDPVGTPVAGARVRIRRRGFYASWVRDQRRMWTAITRADGSFVIRGIPGTRALLDHARVEVWHPIGGAAQFGGVPAEGPVRLRVFPAVRIETAEDSLVRDTDPLAPPVERASILGEIVGIDGEPRQGVMIRDVAHPGSPVKTDERGRFTIQLDGPFPHTLRLEDGKITRELCVESPAAPLRIEFPEVRALEGRVMHAGRPIEGARIRVVYDGAAVERMQTDADGRFTVRRWPRSGPRELVIEEQGFLTARLEDPAAGDIELQRAAALVVHVEDEQGLPRNDVELLVGERRLRSDMNGLVRLYQSSESRPEFDVVPGGPGWIRVGQPQWSDDGEALTLVVRRGERIEGRVVDSENRGVPHILVLAQPTTKDRAIRRAFTNSQGYFVLRALHPERYELRTGDAAHGVEIEAGTTGLVLREESR